jgi:hypothetical protein
MLMKNVRSLRPFASSNFALFALKNHLTAKNAKRNHAKNAKMNSRFNFWEKRELKS